MHKDPRRSRVAATLLLIGVAFAGGVGPVHSAVGAPPHTAAELDGNVSGCMLDGIDLAGSVYVTKSPYSADLTVYQSRSQYSSDLKVFRTKSQYDASDCGIWYFTKSPYSADFSVYFTKSPYSADLSIYFVSSRYSAGPT